MQGFTRISRMNTDLEKQKKKKVRRVRRHPWQRIARFGAFAQWRHRNRRAHAVKEILWALNHPECER